MVHFKKLGREDFASKYGAEIQALNTASGPLLPAFSLSNWKIVRCCKSCFSTQEILPAKQWLTQTNNTIKCNCGHANLADDLTNSLKWWKPSSPTLCSNFADNACRTRHQYFHQSNVIHPQKHHEPMTCPWPVVWCNALLMTDLTIWSAAPQELAARFNNVLHMAGPANGTSVESDILSCVSSKITLLLLFLAGSSSAMTKVRCRCLPLRISYPLVAVKEERQKLRLPECEDLALCTHRQRWGWCQSSRW